MLDFDGFLCEHCGEVASHFHEDYGNVCTQCAKYWTDRESALREEQSDPLAQQMREERLHQEHGYREEL